MAFHDYACVVLDSVTVATDGKDAAIPEARYAELRRALQREFKGDIRLFEHLIVLAMELKKVGLTAASGQLVALAKLGLEPVALEKAAQKSLTTARRAAEKLRSDTRSGTAPSTSVDKPRAPLGVRTSTRRDR